jgi:hypothetical protein
MMSGLARLGRVERFGEFAVQPEIARTIPEGGARDAGSDVAAAYLARLVLTFDFIGEQVLRDNDVAFGADHFGDIGDAPRTVAQTLSLHDDVHGADDHLANGLGGQGISAHGDERFQARQRLARGVRMHRSHRAVMARVHRLQQIEGFRTAYLAHDDAFGTHTKAVSHQIAHVDLALAFEIGRARLQTHDMGLLQLQLGGVLASDDALVHVDIGGQTVEQGRLARTRAARNDDVTARTPDHGEHARPFRRDGAEAHQIVERQLVFAEFSDGKGWSVERERRGDDVDTRAVRKARIADRRAFIDAAANLTYDALADVHELRIVAETNIGELHLAADFDEHARSPVHHDVGDVVAREQGLERAVA